MIKLLCTSTASNVNVRSTTTPGSHSLTASNTWLSHYLVVSRRNARNTPSTGPYCSRQPLKFYGLNKLWIFNTTKNFYTKYFKCENFLLYDTLAQGHAQIEADYVSLDPLWYIWRPKFVSENIDIVLSFEWATSPHSLHSEYTRGSSSLCVIMIIREHR